MRRALLALALVAALTNHAHAAQPKTARFNRLVAKHCPKYVKKFQDRACAYYRAMLFVESKDGTQLIGHHNDPSFGSAQLRVISVQQVKAYRKNIRGIPERIDLIILKLLNDDEFSIKIGLAYFGWLIDVLDDPEKAVMAYNTGIDGLATHESAGIDYLGKVLAALPKSPQSTNPPRLIP